MRQLAKQGGSRELPIGEQESRESVPLPSSVSKRLPNSEPLDGCHLVTSRKLSTFEDSTSFGYLET